MADVLKKRLERLACGFPLSENYFAWQAFGRRYAPSGGPVPPYLDPANFEMVRENAPRVSVHHASFTDYLDSAPDGSLDRYILLDAQDWMNDAMLTGLWQEITRTARPWRARDLPHRRRSDHPSGTHTASTSSRAGIMRMRLSRELTQKDRSAIYGGFHLYILQG